MRQDSVVNLVMKERRYSVPLPPIDRFVPPVTRAQRIVAWCARKLGMVTPYRGVEEEVETKTIRLDEKTEAAISRMVLYFMEENHRLNPQRDLVILWGHDEWARFMFRQAASLVSDMRFNRANGDEYKGMRVVLVSYLSGPLVIRRRDLER